MSFGKMANTFIEIIESTQTLDAEGFVNTGDIVLASVRAYKEDRSATERWANKAAFSTASSLFRFRAIPGVTIYASLVIACADGRYRILSVEDVRGRGRYIEVLAEKLEPTVR